MTRIGEDFLRGQSLGNINYFRSPTTYSGGGGGHFLEGMKNS